MRVLKSNDRYWDSRVWFLDLVADTGSLVGSSEILWQLLGIWTKVLRSSGRY